ncbi:MAG TPA: HAD hydrolase family protein, partial [Planctomycetota bacterium]|nr:HAD hydrolase family protein [Planctomycetota bacterium]
GLTESGEEIKRFSIQDGFGVELLRSVGIEVAFLSGRASRIVEHRARGLGITLHFHGIREKRPQLEAILRERSIEPIDVCYIGDDFLDMSCLRHVGFPVAVANAREEVKREARYVTRASGGDGAFREVAELILQARGQWEALVETYR